MALQQDLVHLAIAPVRVSRRAGERLFKEVEIGPGAEGAPRPGQHDDIRPAALLQGGQRGAALGEHRRVDAVQDLRPVEDDPPEASVAFEEDVRVGHDAPVSGRG